MKLPKELTKVTTLSRSLALILFIALPFMGFYSGRLYQQSLSNYLLPEQISRPLPQVQTDSLTSTDSATWKEFKDPARKYSLNFPQNWLISFGQSPYYKDKMDVHLEGPEGKVDVLWADSYGGACQDPGYEPFQIKSGQEQICHASHIQGQNIPKNTEFWQLQKQFHPGKPEGIYLNAYSGNLNREVLLLIIKSLNITAK